MVQHIVAESAAESAMELDVAAIETNQSPRKRRIEEIEPPHAVKVKTERSMSNGSSFSGTTNPSSVGHVKMEVDPPNPVDEETTKAASILNGVSTDRRTVYFRIIKILIFRLNYILL